MIPRIPNPLPPNPLACHVELHKKHRKQQQQNLSPQSNSFYPRHARHPLVRKQNKMAALPFPVAAVPAAMFMFLIQVVQQKVNKQIPTWKAKLKVREGFSQCDVRRENLGS